MWNNMYKQIDGSQVKIWGEAWVTFSQRHFIKWAPKQGTSERAGGTPVTIEPEVNASGCAAALAQKIASRLRLDPAHSRFSLGGGASLCQGSGPTWRGEGG